MKHDLSTFHAIIDVTTPLDPIERPELTQVRGSITFTDSSVLHVRENYITVSGWIDYSYHWQTADHQLIHRWDNAHEVPFSSSPHHQHIGTEDNVHPSEPMTLTEVLTIIAQRITSG
ncbi:DUF6516 family protein [Spirosoma sp. KUDC1026]|uniref:toxin-antitoxin system TumE family protein n=1 Tax=Spirosoma sp. KUDC1026 TaxID=2745947 RepID=UPI00159BAD23|nr:DUF6516 family protein [Spirosoma sp. KUDC1026]QKZ13428.1 hypothetical protein HU175_12605 [Spirosoma sp. KUDC1026]